MTVVTRPRTSWPKLSLFRGARVYLWLSALALVFAAASLLWPSTPSYDPWSWLIWGREIFNAVTGSGAHADGALQITGGSSWKPLPVIFTTVFALFGSAQPDLWLIIARAGAGLAVLMSVKLTVRITWGVVSRSRAGQHLQDEGWRGRTVAYAPVVFAGAAALICTTFTPSYPGNMLLGYSEGVMAAAFLIAVERAWDGHHRQAFALGIIPCLDRPEVWPVWGLYGLWLMWRDREARLLVIGLGIVMLALWLVPQKLGGGSLSDLFSHPRQNHSHGSAVNTAFPFWNELAHKLQPLVVARLELAALLMIGFTTVLIARARERAGGWRRALQEYPAAATGLAAGLFGFLWWLGISVETEAGFAGNPRYAIIGVMFVCIGGCVAYGWACVGLGTLAVRGLQRWRRRSDAGFDSRAGNWILTVGTATLVVLVVFAIVPDRFTKRMPTVNSIRYSLRYQAHLRNEISALIQEAGGPQKVMGCGSVMAHNLQVTMVAWSLQVPIPWIQALPTKFSTRNGPNVVFQDGPKNTSAGNQGPSDLQMQAWEAGWKQKNGSRYRVLKSAAVTLYMDCSTYSKT